MIETGETMGDLPKNTIVFCERPWKAPVAAMAVLLLATFAWGIYLLNTYDEDDLLRGSDDLSVTQFLVRNVALPDVQRLYGTVPPAVVGVGNGGVNAGPSAAGAIVGANGYVVTTLHAVANLPDISVQVFTPAGVRRYAAQVVKAVPAHDLVLLKMQTAERFMFFRMAHGQTVVPGQGVYAFGRSMNGASVVRQGQVQSANVALDVNGVQITHLIRSDAVYGWEQNGGPLVNAQGEMVGINIAAQGAGGRIEGFTIPAQVVISHFQDVLKFKVTTPAKGMAAAQPPQGAMLQAAAGSSSWWANARTVANGQAANSLGLNVVQGGVVANAPVAGAGAAHAGGLFDPDHAGGLTIAGYSMADVLGLMMLALAAGVTGGMMTMGGGVLQVAGMMVFFGYGMYLIRPVAFLTNIAVYGAAAWRNNKAQLVQWDKTTPLIPWGVAGVVLGYFIGNAIGDRVVGILLGVFALLMAIKAVHEVMYLDKAALSQDDQDDALDQAQAADELDEVMGMAEGRKPTAKLDRVLPEGPARSVVLGMPMGLISGVLGISGGVIEVPLQRYIGKISLQNAIANSSVLVFWASVAGTLVSFLHGTSTGLIHWEAPVFLALLMIPGAYVGGLLGARLMRVLPLPVLKGIYALTMAAIAVKMLVAR